MKVSAVYKITNTVTGDFYIGSSKDIKNRWTAHKCQSTWNRCSNNPMYLDMKKFGIDKFSFQILEEVESDQLKEVEQQFIEILKPTYNNKNSNGCDFKRYKEYHKKYRQSERGKESQKKAQNKYQNQLCSYNGETLTLCALASRFRRRGIPHPTIEAKKYLVL